MFCFLTSLLCMLFLMFVLAPSIWQGQIQDANEDTVKVYRLQTHMYMYINIHTHTHTHIHIHTYTHIYTYIYTYTHIHIHTHMVDSKFLPVSIRWYLCGFYRKFHCGASLWVVMPLLTGCSSYSLRMVPCSVYASPLHAFLLDRKGPVWLLNQFYRKLHASLPFLGQPTIHALLLNSSNSSNYCSP